MPYLIDGLKPSYRRIIWTGLEYPDKLVKVATLAGVCGGKYSPHSPDSLPAVVSEMVLSKIFIGQGSHGSPCIYKPLSIDAAASRYIEAKVNPSFRKMVSPLIPLVPFKESELDSMYKEPTYIPSPLPLSMTFNSLGIGVGIRSLGPNFSMKSMLEAYEKNDYKKLRSNTDLKINLKQSDLKDIWEKGEGRVTYEFFIDNKFTLEGRKGVLLYGDSRFIQLGKLSTTLLTTKANPKEEELGWIDRGAVEMINLSSKKTGNRLFFTLKKHQRGTDKVTFAMLEKELNRIKYNSTKYKLAVTDGKTSEVRPLRDWIHESYTNYTMLVDEYKTKKETALKLKIEVSKNSEIIAKSIMKNPKITKSEIAKELKLDREVVAEALKKSLSSLMKSNKDKDIKAYTSEIKEIKKLKPKDFYEDFIAG